MDKEAKRVLCGNLGFQLGSEEGIHQWLAELPEKLEEQAGIWKLTDLQPVGRGCSSYTIYCDSPQGKAVLKCSPIHQQLVREAAMLTGLGETGASGI